MLGRAILCILFLIVAAVCALTWNVTFEGMVGEVNLRLPIDQRLSHSWWYYGKYRRLLQHYRRLYPDGTRARRLQYLGALMMVSLALIAFTGGFGVGIALWVGLGGTALLWFVVRE